MPCLCLAAGRLPAAGLGAAPRGDQPHRGLGGLEPHGLPDCYRRAQVAASPFFRNIIFAMYRLLYDFMLDEMERYVEIVE